MILNRESLILIVHSACMNSARLISGASQLDCSLATSLGSSSIYGWDIFIGSSRVVRLSHNVVCHSNIIIRCSIFPKYMVHLIILVPNSQL